MLATDLLHGTIAAQPGQHDRDLLLGRPRPVLPLLAQPRLLVGRAAHAEPGAGRSLRGSAPPRPSGTPSQLPVNAGPGSGASTTPTSTPLRSRCGPEPKAAQRSRTPGRWECTRANRVRQSL